MACKTVFSDFIHMVLCSSSVLLKLHFKNLQYIAFLIVLQFIELEPLYACVHVINTTTFQSYSFTAK